MSSSKNIFLRKDDRYVLDFAKRRTEVDLGELKVDMPTMPPEKMIKNFGKKKSDQFYTREVVPDDIHKWGQDEIEDYAASAWHRRLNGEWQFINGKPYYIPGSAIYMFDHWTLESGKRPDFRYSALTFAWSTWWAERQKNVFGLFNVKTRRLGDTANTLSWMHERTTRHRGVRSGFQSHGDAFAKKSFARVAKAADRMPFFFKPNRTGSDKEYLAYMSASNLMSRLKIQKTKDDIEDKRPENEFIGSFMDFGPSSNLYGDGEQFFTYFLDECLKVPPFRLDVIKQWNNIRRSMSLHGEYVIYGKAVLGSTVEPWEKKNQSSGEDMAGTIEIANRLWDGSDPAMIKDSPDGRTLTGLVRMFRGYQIAAIPDKYGFPQVEKAEKFRAAKLEKALKFNNQDEITDIYRKEPATPEQALMSSNKDAPLYPETCQTRLHQIKRGEDRWGEPIPNYRLPYEQGVLVWQNGQVNTKVLFVPQEGGPWTISQHPMVDNHVTMRDVDLVDDSGRWSKVPSFVPSNPYNYRGGVDPKSSNPSLITTGSHSALVIKRRWNPDCELKEIKFNTHGVILNPEDLLTNRYVCTYFGNPRNPLDSFREMVKGLWYYGSPCMIEMDKPEFYSFMRASGYSGFVMTEPTEISRIRGRKKNDYIPGVRSRADIVGMYVNALKQEVHDRWPAIDHPELLTDFSNFIPKKRGKFDLTVAAGMVAIGEMENRYIESEEEEVNSWADNPFAIL